MGRGRKLESLKDFERALKSKYGIGKVQSISFGLESRM